MLAQSMIRWISLCVVIGFVASASADGPVTAVAISPDGTHVVLGSQQGIEIRSWPEMNKVALLATQLVNVHDLKFSPDGKQLLAAGGVPAERGQVELWSFPQGKLVNRIADHADVVYRVSWSPDANRWASCGGDGVCFVNHLDDNEKRTQYSGHSRAVLSIRWLDSGTLVSVGVDHTVRIWDSHTGNHMRTLDNHLGCVNDLAIRPVIANQSPGSKHTIIATVSDDRTVRLWQPQIGRLLRFTRLDARPLCVVWSADAKQLVVGCHDGRVRIIDWEKLELIREIDGEVGRIYELELDPSGNLFLVAGEKGCQLHVAETTDK